jgi:hypothetical protein
MGLESNTFFRKLWTDKTGKELHGWQSKHGHIPHIATEEATQNVMKVRLADYVGISLPFDAATGVDNGDGDGDTVDATAGATKGDGHDTDNSGAASVILSDIYSNAAIGVEPGMEGRQAAGIL